MDGEASEGARFGGLRLAIGLTQGLVAWGLVKAAEPHGWGRSAPGLFAALVLVTAFAPMIPLAGLGRMRPPVLAAWTAAAAAALALLGAYDLWREPVQGFYASGPRLWPSAQVAFFSAAALYIAHHLLEPCEVERRWWPSYVERFESAWRHGFQLALSLIFTGLFWGVLQLGAGLFQVIGVEAVATLLRQGWFGYPATAAAFAAAVHLTDVRPALIRGVRAVGLTLMAWLLPLMAALTGGFLLALLLRGVGPLWKTGRTTPLLIGAVSLLVLLINAAYQDGREREAVATPVRWAARFGALLLTPSTGLAAWSAWLRITQYGLSPERTAGVAAIAASSIYAVGYGWAAVPSSPWLRRIERVNVLGAVTVLALILALLSPLADPARLSVADQVGRLERRGTLPPRFDYAFLRFRAARFGREVLAGLARSPDADIAARAKRAQALKAPTYGGEGAADASSTEAAFAHATVRPAGAVLPDSFRRQDWTKADGVFGRSCLRDGSACTLIVRDLDGDGRPEVMVSDSGLVAYRQEAQGASWVLAGRYSGAGCASAKAALSAGDVTTVAPILPDLMAGGARLAVSGVDGRCPSAPPAPVSSPAPPAELGPVFSKPPAPAPSRSRKDDGSGQVSASRAAAGSPAKPPATGPTPPAAR